MRTTLRWLGLLLTLVITAAYVTSIKWDVVYGGGPTGRYFFIRRGTVCINRLTPPVRSVPRWSLIKRRYPFQWWVGWMNTPNYQALIVPLWVPLLAVGIPTASRWRSHLRPRRLPGACALCGYALTGLTAGTPCPECGKPTP